MYFHKCVYYMWVLGILFLNKKYINYGVWNRIYVWDTEHAETTAIFSALRMINLFHCFLDSYLHLPPDALA